MSRNTKPTLELVFNVIAPYIVAFPTYRGVLSDQLFNTIFVHKRESDLSIFRQFFFRVFPSGGSARGVAPNQPDQGKFDVSKCSFFFFLWCLLLVQNLPSLAPEWLSQYSILYVFGVVSYGNSKKNEITTTIINKVFFIFTTLWPQVIFHCTHRPVDQC